MARTRRCKKGRLKYRNKKTGKRVCRKRRFLGRRKSSSRTARTARAPREKKEKTVLKPEEITVELITKLAKAEKMTKKLTPELKTFIDTGEAPSNGRCIMAFGENGVGKQNDCIVEEKFIDDVMFKEYSAYFLRVMKKLGIKDSKTFWTLSRPLQSLIVLRTLGEWFYHKVVLYKGSKDKAHDTVQVLLETLLNKIEMDEGAARENPNSRPTM